MEAERGRRLDRAFSEAAARLDDRDRGFVYELAYGVTRFRGRLDHLIAPHVHRGLGSVERRTLELLRLGAYQLLYMDGVPAYAAVSETVEQVRALVGSGPTGFVNAVLRRVRDAGDGRDRFPDPHVDAEGFLSTWGSHPAWLIRRWMRRWDAETVMRVVEAANRPPSVNVVPLEATVSEAVARLAEASIAASPVGMGTKCLRLSDAKDVVPTLDILTPAIVQDPAANLVARYADVPSGAMVVDLCAAPGGKALALTDGPGRLLAADRSESRIAMLKENVTRTGRSVDVIVADALAPAIRSADVVLLDVPCTGTGTLGRHPDARWRLSEASVQEMASLQRRMLAAAARIVVPGGLVVYSTCTLEAEENEELIAEFLDGRPDFTVDVTSLVPSEVVDGAGYLMVLPRSGAHDGAFAARLRRAA